MLNLVLLGLPGSGKSTQSATIAAYFRIPSVSAGALLRQAVNQGTEVGQQVHDYLLRGDLAPNHLVDRLVFDRLKQPDCQRGFVLDGYPRTLDQAEALDRFMRQTGWKLSKVIYLRVSEAVMVARLSARRFCPVCGAIYNLRYDPPRSGDICRACHTPLRYLSAETIECEACKIPFALREDDRPEVVMRRLQIQRRTLRPVLEHFQQQGLSTEIDADKPPEQVFDEILAVLGGKQRRAGEAR